VPYFQPAAAHRGGEPACGPRHVFLGLRQRLPAGGRQGGYVPRRELGHFSFGIKKENSIVEKYKKTIPVDKVIKV